jgi:hypothetical protein
VILLCLAGLALDFTTYDALLKQYVLENGRVRYADLKANIAPLSRLVENLAAVSPESHPQLFPTRNHQLAYWLNAYNALVLWSFAKDYPRDKDRLSGALTRGRFFFLTKFTAGGKRRTLDDIEKNTIRKQFRDPRVHFALVCASASCPYLAREAYAGDRLDQQLDREARKYLNQERNVAVDVGKREIRVSKIFDWFKEDFGSTPEQIVRFIARYRDQPLPGRWSLRYFDYDWSLNDAR